MKSILKIKNKYMKIKRERLKLLNKLATNTFIQDINMFNLETFEFYLDFFSVNDSCLTVLYIQKCVYFI